MRMRLIMSNLCQVEGDDHEYLRDIVNFMEAFNVKLAVRCLEDNTDLVELVANLHDRPWNATESDHVIGTVIVLPGTYASNSKSELSVDADVREAIEELRKTFQPNAQVNDGLATAKIIYGLDRLNRCHRTYADELREERKSSTV